MAEPLNATFFAFRKRGKSGVLTSAAIGYAIVLIALSGAFFAINYQVLVPLMQLYVQSLQAATTGEAPQIVDGLPAGFFTLILSIIPFMFAFYVALAAFEAACLRWMIRGESGGGFLGLTLGRHTWNVYLSYWMWFFLNFRRVCDGRAVERDVLCF